MTVIIVADTRMRTTDECDRANMSDDVDLDADINDCCHGVEGPCPICDADLFDENGELK